MPLMGRSGGLACILPDPTDNSTGPRAGREIRRRDDNYPAPSSNSLHVHTHSFRGSARAPPPHIRSRLPATREVLRVRTALTENVYSEDYRDSWHSRGSPVKLECWLPGCTSDPTRNAEGHKPPRDVGQHARVAHLWQRQGEHNGYEYLPDVESFRERSSILTASHPVGNRASKTPIVGCRGAISSIR